MSTQQFSYNVLKNIIEHLSLEKRIQISNEYPTLKTVEQSSELYLESLRLDDFEFLTWLSLADRRILKVRVLNCEYFWKDLPTNFQLQVHELKLQAEQIEILQALQPLITNLPLEKLSITVDSPDHPFFKEQLVIEAKHLNINKVWMWKQPIVTDLVKMTNKEIHVKQTFCEMARNDVLTLAKSWLDREKCPEVGTRFTLSQSVTEIFVQEVMELMKKKLGAVEDSRTVSISMRSGDKLKLFGGRNKEDKLYLRMEVVE